MSDLERARAHLLTAQKALAELRAVKGFVIPPVVRGPQRGVYARGMRERHRAQLKIAEDCVLAALSWVWEEQQGAQIIACMPTEADREKMRLLLRQPQGVIFLEREAA